MSAVDEFLGEVLPRHVAAAEALHHGDPGPFSDLLAWHEPVSLLPGLAAHKTGRVDILASLRSIAPRFTNCTPLTFELIAADVSGELAYTVGYEHSNVSIDGGPMVANDLRVTHIYRREEGVWRLVHRHGGGGPSGPS